MTREQARLITLDSINSNIQKYGEDAIAVRATKVGKNSWTWKECKEAVLRDKPLAETTNNMIDGILRLDEYLVEKRGYGLLDEEQWKKYK